MKYRSEIDGLRALAVVPVILFHAGFELFSGGFVGVDVFFVISGYLITTILIEDIENNRFSLVKFYERRARRILPALFFVMLICVPFAWMWMLPHQLKDFSQSFVAVIFFASNILFWRESGYFAAAAEEKPLLHTWSLAVEEQYYLLFPILLFLAWRFGKNRVFLMIVVLAAISLAIGEWGWRNAATANFYLAPTRAWELFAGSIAAFVVQKRGVQSNNTMSTLGLSAVVFAIFAYDESTPFPSIYALVPVIGVVFLILFAGKETFAARFLSTKAMVGIGLISYSAYLWHQPLFAFARLRLLEQPSPWLMSVLAIASLLLAIVSWRYVEAPFRKETKIGRKNIFILSSLVASVLAVFGVYGHLEAGFPSRFDQSVREILEVESLHLSLRDDGGCNRVKDETYLEKCKYGLQDNVNVAMVGDSHASALTYALGRMGEEEGFGIYRYTKNSCPLVLGLTSNVNEKCFDFVEALLQDIASSDEIDTVIVSGRLAAYITDHPYDNSTGGVEGARDTLYSILGTPFTAPIRTRKDEIISGFRSAVLRLSEENPNKRIVLLTPIPEHGWHIPNQLAERQIFGGDAIPTLPIEIYKERNSEILPEILNLASLSNVSTYDMTQFLCDETQCFSVNDGIPLYYDGDHLSNYGARFALAKIQQYIRCEQSQAC